jgi:glutathione synthase/RimK-type ligase-like ATP-grasp enzyme
MTDQRMVAIGLDSDPTFVHLAVEARVLGAPLVLVDLRELVAEGTGELHGRWRGLAEGLRAWLETTPAMVINRPGGHDHNGTKPLHEYWLAQQGFDVPPSVTSSRRDILERFAAGGPTIIKTCSGIRANARRVEPEEFDEFEPEQGPVHLQRLVTGADVRAHVVGDQVIAMMIESDGVDYRTGTSGRWSVYEPSDPLRFKMVNATRGMGLLLAGWDFKVDSDGRAWCLEANAMPGYSSYDRRLGGSISKEILRLMGSPVDAPATVLAGVS